MHGRRFVLEDVCRRNKFKLAEIGEDTERLDGWRLQHGVEKRNGKYIKQDYIEDGV